MDDKKIDWSKVMIIAKLKEGDIFYFKHRKQSIIKGREFVYIGMDGKKCTFKEVKTSKVFKTEWNREVILK